MIHIILQNVVLVCATVVLATVWVATAVWCILSVIERWWWGLGLGFFMLCFETAAIGTCLLQGL